MIIETTITFLYQDDEGITLVEVHSFTTRSWAAAGEGIRMASERGLKLGARIAYFAQETAREQEDANGHGLDPNRRVMI